MLRALLRAKQGGGESPRNVVEYCDFQRALGVLPTFLPTLRTAEQLCQCVDHSRESSN